MRASAFISRYPILSPSSRFSLSLSSAPIIFPSLWNICLVHLIELIVVFLGAETWQARSACLIQPQPLQACPSNTSGKRWRLLARPDKRRRDTNNYEFSSTPLNLNNLRGAVIMSYFITAAIINCPKGDRPGGSVAQEPDLLMEALLSPHHHWADFSPVDLRSWHATSEVWLFREHPHPLCPYYNNKFIHILCILRQVPSSEYVRSHKDTLLSKIKIFYVTHVAAVVKRGLSSLIDRLFRGTLRVICLIQRLSNKSRHTKLDGGPRWTPDLLFVLQLLTHLLQHSRPRGTAARRNNEIIRIGLLLCLSHALFCFCLVGVATDCTGVMSRGFQSLLFSTSSFIPVIHSLMPVKPWGASAASSLARAWTTTRTTRRLTIG